MGTIKTTNIETITGSGTLTLGQSGETISVPSGVSMSVPNGGLSGQNYPAFAVKGTGDQSFLASTFTTLTFPTEVFDTDNAFASNTFTVPSGKAGKYFFSVQAEAKNHDAGFQLYWVKNGTRDVLHRLNNHGHDITDDPGVSMTALLDLSDGDTVGVDGYRPSTAGDVRYKWFNGFRIGA